MVAKSAVLLTDAKSRNSHQEARLILFRMWPGALASLRLSERAASKKGMNKPDFYYTDREQWNVRREVVICTASVAYKI